MLHGGFVKKNVIFACAVLFIALISAIIMYSTGQNSRDGASEAVITIANGDTILLPLNKDEIYEFGTETGALLPFTIEVESGTARFINSQCPDHVCESFGRISLEFEAATCAPGGVVLSVK